MRQSVFISGLIPEAASKMLAEHFDVVMHREMRLLTKEEILEGLAGKDALLCLLSDNIDADIINANPQLKVIANYGAGYNNIDVAAASARKIPVTNTPGVSTNATADLTIGLLIAIARRIVEGDKNARAGKFTGWAPLYHLGVDVTGKTLGIIGLGNIGKAVAKRARAFDMKVLYYSRTRLDPADERALGVEYCPFTDLLARADFVSLHLSYSPAVHHMIGERELAIMKPTAFIINAARGPIIDEAALAAALERGIIAGAALDVYEFEPHITPALKKLDNVILCPHLGNATVETREAMAVMAAQNIIAALTGKIPPNCVNAYIYEK